MRSRQLSAKSAKSSGEFEYDVCLSFAGEDRPYVNRVAECLISKGVRVFYDEYKQVELWGKDLYSHFDYVYRHAARYCVVFVSRHYASKLWTNHERRSAQARAFSESREYILPARFDDTEIPGLPETVGYIDLRRAKPKKLANSIIQKLGPRQPKNFFPPVPDRLLKRLRATTERRKERVNAIALSFFEAFKRMSDDERATLTAVFMHGCVADLPKNIHINLDLLRRVTGFPPARATSILGGLRSLGFYIRLRDEPNSHQAVLGSDTIAEITFSALTSAVEPRDDETGVVAEMLHGAAEDLCEECGLNALMRADFSQLASATKDKERHAARRKRR
jgi:hypothetical protein